MDAGLAAVIAASISTVVGGAVGFFSAYLTASQARKATLEQTTLPRQMEALDTVALFLFKSLSGEELVQDEWDRYIAACFWLPPSVRDCCLGVLDAKSDVAHLKRSQERVIAHYAKMIGGN